MKNILSHFTPWLSLAIIVTIAGCEKTPQPILTENPYADDYSEITALSMRHLWQAANIHDPAIVKSDSFYYVYSTDAYYMKRGVEFFDIDKKIGNVPIRRSKDLVNWEFVGWALDTIPAAAVEHVHKYANNKGAENIWAPYVYKHNNTYRLYYSVSSFGANTSYIGLAESPSADGPFIDKGCIVKTDTSSAMNAIDASVITDVENGRMWMHYGSYFNGLYCVELDPQTGLTLKDGDLGHLVASRAEKADRIIEAPEIIYNPELKKYFLFVAYEPLFTYYNIRVGRSDFPEGPFYDYFGNNMADSTNNYPILTHSYAFDNHPGWSGNAHCAVFNDNGTFYMLHQGRLAPENLMMVMHVREMYWLPSGWPVVSPQRFAGKINRTIKGKDLTGTWEVINLNDLPDQTTLWQGQIPPGGWTYKKEVFNTSEKIDINKNGSTSWSIANNWKLNGDILYFDDVECSVFYGWDWENQTETILFSGILTDGTGIWGKKIVE
jgi:arabinan endo-1,5-alpha-L-arabinosidase